jgi:Fe-S-cluster containining protein
MDNSSGYPFTFDQSACSVCAGICCRWGGYVWITEEEMIQMAEVMNLSLDNFAGEYVKAAYGRLSLQERLRDGEYHCAMFDPFNNRCLVYEARPRQCKTFPFWDQYRENYVKLLELCPGIISKDDI